jgi:hypothetical protein
MSELNTAEVAALSAGAAPAAPATTPRARRTKEELIAVYKAKIAALENGTATVREPKAPKVEFVPVVDQVYDFYFGRGDNRAVLRGKVLGIREPGEGEKGGRIAKVMVGEGYDADIKGVFLSAFIDPAKAEAEVDTDAALDLPDGDDQE